MKRSKHNLSHYKLLTSSMGDLTPVGCFPVLPGDTVQLHSSALIRVSPMVAPVMHPIVVRIHHWFVPYRLLWTGWEDFITGVDDTPPPTHGSYEVQAGDVWDYFGVKPGANIQGFLQFHNRAYNMIWNNWYRDQDLQASVDEGANQAVLQCAWEKDYFTSARPWPQKGDAITLPLGTTAPVVSAGGGGPTFDGGGLTASPLRMQAANGNVAWVTPPGSTATATWNTTDLEADLSAATAVDVNDVRRAFALQRYQEARARYGSRYTEYLRYLGVAPADSRLQLPEYIGGGKQTIAISEVLQTTPQASPSVSDFGVGDMYGHGISAMRTRKARKFIQEHGMIMSLMSVRPKAIYADGYPREMAKFTKEDYWQRELEHIGQQPIYNREVYTGAAAPADAFGYQDRYSEYRSIPSTIAGDFRSTLDHWHMARLFGSEPTLNGDFVKCDATKRINAVTSMDNLWTMVNHRIVARRLVSRNAAARIY